MDSRSVHHVHKLHRAGGSGRLEEHIACRHSRRSAVDLSCQQQHINGGAHFGATCRRRRERDPRLGLSSPLVLTSRARHVGEFSAA
eukprot:2934721-Rhodomonas_salina.1